MTLIANWIELDGLVNARDLGGRTTSDGRQVLPGRVLRTDNLDDLTTESIRQLVEGYRLSDIVDLRTNRERKRSGHGRLNGFARVHPFTLYPDDDPDASLPPWYTDLSVLDSSVPQSHAEGMAAHYFGYLQHRPDNLLAAMRTVAAAEGAAIVHCAAGKDRTGTTCALILGAVGVERDQIVADYAASDERIPAILARLGEAATVGSPEHDAAVASQATPPEVMELLLDQIDQHFGNIGNYLDRQGWTSDDQTRLETKLLG